MKPLSMDLRERVLAACDEGGETREEVAERFGVSPRSVYYWLGRRRDSGSAAPKPHAGGFASALDPTARNTLRELVAQQPDAYLHELCAALQRAGGPSLKKSRLGQVLSDMGLPRKKVPA